MTSADDDSTPFIALFDVSKSYTAARPRGRVHVLADLNLTVRTGEFVTLVGRNGSGKTTLLNLLAGVLEPDTGTIRINGRPPRESACGFVFQSFAESLLPWRTVLDNIRLPLELRGTPGAAITPQVRETLHRLGFELPLHRYPYELSGGQQQMVAIARALALKPSVLLLDEPFSQLDFETRLRMNDVILDVWRRTCLTTIFVSHDLDEALALGDRVLVLGGNPSRICAEIRPGHGADRTAGGAAGIDYRALRAQTLDAFQRQVAP